MKKLIEKIIRRHLFLNKGDIDKTIQSSSTEISDFVEYMLNQLTEKEK